MIRPLLRHLLGPLLVLGCLLPTFAFSEASAPVALSAEQRAWLAEHKQLRVGLVLQQPYAQLDRRLQKLSGANVELMKWLAESLQVELVWQTYADQAALDEAAKARQIDLAPGQMQTPTGLRDWLYTDPYMRVPQLVVGARVGGAAVDFEQLGLSLIHI